MDATGETELGESAREVSKGDSHGDTSSKMWSVYLSEADRQDKALAENWKGDMDGILIFTGLFAATVAAFCIESYKRLSSDTGAASVLLLNQISQQLSALSNGTQIPPPPLYSDSSFRPTAWAVRINILWFLSLILSLVCALAATLMQQWARRYLQLVQAQATSYKRARIREYLFEGVQTFGLSQAVEAIPVLLHVAIFLFFLGLGDFLFSIDNTVGRVITGAMCAFGAIYILLTFLPNVRPNCPYRTPFSRDSLKWFLALLTAPALLAIYCSRCVLRRDAFENFRLRFLLFLQTLLWTMSDAVRSLQEHIDKRALQRAVARVDDDNDIETLVEGIPGFIIAGTSKAALGIVQDLLDLQQHRPLGHLINRLIQTCTPDSYRGLAEHVRRRRAFICLDTVRSLTGTYSTSFSYELFGFQTWPSVNSLKRDEDPTIAINAISTGALAASTYLHSLFVGGVQVSVGHVKKLFDLVNAPWPQDRLYSGAGCHLLVLQGFVSALLPHLRPNNVAPASFLTVWETLPRILNKARSWDHSEPEPHIKESFLALWAELRDRAGTEPPALPWDSIVIGGRGPIRFRKPTMEADDLPPIVQLMSMLRPTVERLRKQDVQEDAQRTQNDHDAAQTLSLLAE